MPALVAGIHAFLANVPESKTLIAGTVPGHDCNEVVRCKQKSTLGFAISFEEHDHRVDGSPDDLEDQQAYEQRHRRGKNADAKLAIRGVPSEPEQDEGAADQHCPAGDFGTVLGEPSPH